MTSPSRILPHFMHSAVPSAASCWMSVLPHPSHRIASQPELGETEQGETEQTDAAPALRCRGSAGDWSAARKERALSTALETPGHDKP